ncbi:18578_t:CDS:2, partial [Funneliformis geosporum]
VTFTDTSFFLEKVSLVHNVYYNNTFICRGVSPEILKGEPTTNSTDIYSFGIIMWILSAGIVPWCNTPYDHKLMNEICLGQRPKIIRGIPDIFTKLMKKCWDPNPLKRPTAFELHEILESWVTDIDDSNISDFSNTDENNILESERNKLHRQGFYHKDISSSRLVDFSQLIN